MLQPFVDKHEFAGAVALVVGRDKVLSVDVTGFTDIAGGKAMTPDAVIQAREDHWKRILLSRGEHGLNRN